MWRDLFWKTVDRLDDEAERLRQAAREKTSSFYSRLRASEFASLKQLNQSRQARRLAVSQNYLLHNPIFNTLMAGLLFLALAVTGIAADNELAVWTLWLPLPFAFAALLPILGDVRALRRGGSLFLIFLFFLCVGGVRFWVASQGPIPYASYPELMGAFCAFLIALSLWITACRQAILVYLVWIAGLAVIFLSRLPLSRSSILFRPDLLPILLSILWGFVAFGGGLGNRNDSNQDWERRRQSHSSSGALICHLVALALGGMLAWFCLVDQSLGRDPAHAAALTRGGEAISLLWAKSFLFGWGRNCLQHLALAISEPMQAEFQNWEGWMGLLGAQGIAGMIGAVILSLTLMSIAMRRARRGALRLTSPPQLALLAAQTLLALMTLGGPRTSLPFILILGWIGLGLAPDRRSLRERAAWHPSAYSQFGFIARLACAGVSLVLILFGLIASAGPAWARSFVNGIQVGDFQDARLGRKIGLARTLSPWDPRIELAEGMRLREELQATPIEKWNESLYLRACDAYRRAHRLDPYDPLITLQLAKLQQTARRAEDASGTILNALAVTPASEVLIDWLFLYAASQKNNDLAMDMIYRGLQIRPNSAKWWRRRYGFEFMAGRGPEAGLSLNTALTGDLNDPNLIKASFQRREMVMQAADAEKP